MVYPLFLHTKDVMLTHGVSEKTARQIIKDINVHFKLSKRPFVSLKCYCAYFMVDKDDVAMTLEHAKRAS